MSVFILFDGQRMSLMNECVIYNFTWLRPNLNVGKFFFHSLFEFPIISYFAFGIAFTKYSPNFFLPKVESRLTKFQVLNAVREMRTSNVSSPRRTWNTSSISPFDAWIRCWFATARGRDLTSPRASPPCSFTPSARSCWRGGHRNLLTSSLPF